MNLIFTLIMMFVAFQVGVRMEFEPCNCQTMPQEYFTVESEEMETCLADTGRTIVKRIVRQFKVDPD